jgi:hypothetical protein
LQQRVIARFAPDRLRVMMNSPVPVMVCLAGAGMHEMEVDMTTSPGEHEFFSPDSIVAGMEK